MVSWMKLDEVGMKASEIDKISDIRGLGTLTSSKISGAANNGGDPTTNLSINHHQQDTMFARRAIPSV